MFFYGIMASMDGHFRSLNRMEIVCNSLSFRGTSFQYSVIQLYLSLVEIGNLYLNFGRVWYIICQRRKESRYYLFNISKSRVLDYSIILLADSTFSKGMAVSLRLAAY